MNGAGGGDHIALFYEKRVEDEHKKTESKGEK